MPKMSEDGLWTVQFRSSLGLFGAGVVVITGKRLIGGDPGYYYDGKFTLENGNLAPKQASFFKLRGGGVGGFPRTQFSHSGRAAG